MKRNYMEYLSIFRFVAKRFGYSLMGSNDDVDVNISLFYWFLHPHNLWTKIPLAVYSAIDRILV